MDLFLIPTKKVPAKKRNNEQNSYYYFDTQKEFPDEIITVTKNCATNTLKKFLKKFNLCKLCDTKFINVIYDNYGPCPSQSWKIASVDEHFTAKGIGKGSAKGFDQSTFHLPDENLMWLRSRTEPPSPAADHTDWGFPELSFSSSSKCHDTHTTVLAANLTLLYHWEWPSRGVIS